MLKIISLVVTAACIQLRVDSNSTIQPTNTTKTQQNQTLAQNLIPLRKVLERESPHTLVEKLLSRKDGLPHLLLTDVQAITRSLASEFPDVVSVQSIGTSVNGRSIDAIEISSGAGDKPAILITGATHPRELISTSVTLFEALRLVQMGVVKKSPTYEKLISQNRYYFVPVLNPDGLAKIEDEWNGHGDILYRRKNMANRDDVKCDEDGFHQIGVDLNRNYPLYFGEIDQQPMGMMGGPSESDVTNPCAESYPGPEPFSEPESRAFRDFVSSHANELAFVINMHSYFNAFVWPFNGTPNNPIEDKRPGLLSLFEKIASEAQFPSGEMFGTSRAVFGYTIGGDADDWVVGTYGIPSVTAELGQQSQYNGEWVAKSISDAQMIADEQSPWLEYIYQRLPEYQKMRK